MSQIQEQRHLLSFRILGNASGFYSTYYIETKILSGNSTYLAIKPTKKARVFAPKKKTWEKSDERIRFRISHPTHLGKLEEIPPSHVYPNTSFDDGQVIGCFAISNWTAISCWELLMSLQLWAGDFLWNFPDVFQNVSWSDSFKIFELLNCFHQLQQGC